MTEMPAADAFSPATPLSVAERLNFGLEAHNRGHLAVAEAAYRAVLTEAGDNYNAAYLLGVLMAQTGRLEEGAAWTGRAAQLQPRWFEAASQWGQLLERLGRFAEALGVYDRALALNVDDAATLVSRAAMLQRLRRPGEALAAYDHALAQAPALLDAHFGRAMALHELMRFEEAVASYDAAAALAPQNAEIWNNRGNSLKRLERFEEALASFDRALAMRPDYPEAHSNRGNALKELKRYDEAITSFDRALTLSPRLAEALNNRANALQSAERLSEALTDYDAALAIRPDYADALINRANALMKFERFDDALAGCVRARALHPGLAEVDNLRGDVLVKQGRFAEATAAYGEALAKRPLYPEALNNRGSALKELKRYEEALADFDLALTIRPGYAKAHNNRGNVLFERRNYGEAAKSYTQALAIEPDYAEALSNLGIVLHELGRPDAALARYDRALAIRPALAEAHNNRGNALLDLKRPEDALAAYDRALTLKPGYLEALNNRGAALKELNRLEEALASHDAALAQQADFADARYNRSLVALLRGDFAAGWTDYERRWDRHDADAPRFKASYPVWRGEDIAGKSILVYDEQGLGDVIQFSRYLSLLAERGAQATFLVRRKLSRLISTLDSRAQVTTVRPQAGFDYQCALMSLPLAFGSRLETIPAVAGYLSAEPELVDAWRSRLGSQGFKVGVAWQGERRGRVDVGRSFPLLQLFGLSKVHDVRLIALQKGDGVEQLRELPEGMIVETLGEAFDAGGDAFVDTAAVMESLDLIITSDTAIAHLAGALGRPVWVALKHVPDWRWLRDRTDSPWHPTMRLFRQSARDDWRGLFAEIEVELAHAAARARRAAWASTQPGQAMSANALVKVVNTSSPPRAPAPRKTGLSTRYRHQVSSVVNRAQLPKVAPLLGPSNFRVGPKGMKP